MTDSNENTVTTNVCKLDKFRHSIISQIINYNKRDLFEHLFVFRDFEYNYFVQENLFQ